MQYTATKEKAPAQTSAGTAALFIKAVADNKLFSLWLLGSVWSAVAGFSGLVPSQLVQKASVGTFGAIQAAAVVGSLQEKRLAAATSKKEIDRSRFEKEVERLAADRTDLQNRQAELNKVEAQLTSLQASLKTHADTYRDKITFEVNRDAQEKAQKAIAAKQIELDQAIAAKVAMQATYQEKSTKMAKETGLIVSKVQQSRKDLGDKAAQTISTSNEVLAKERTQVNQVLENLGRDIKSMASELAAHKELVAKLQAPKQFKFKSFEADVANQIQAFLSSRGVVVGCDSIGKVHYGLTPIYFEAINCDLETVKKELEAVQLVLGLVEKPTAEIENGKIKMTVQLSQDKSAKPTKDLVIVDPPLSKLEAAINDSIHVRIVAQSGSGKTVLLGNLINYLAGGISDDYVLSDPKTTDPVNWGNLKPDYYGRECLAHFFGLTETCLTRIDEAAASVKATGQLPDFEFQFHVVDELEFLYGLSEVSSVKEYNSKLFKINAKSMLKVGREHKMKLLFVTQSPLPSDLNLRKNDFENCSSIFLGSQISAGLNSTDADGLLKDVPAEKIAQLKAEHRARMDRGDKWLYLFFNPSQPENSFIGRCPSPGHYAALKNADLAENDVSQSAGFGGVAQERTAEGKNGQTLATPIGAPAPKSEGKSEAEGKTAKSGQGAQGLSAALEQGTHCPDCGHHSVSYKRKKPSATGKVSLRCKNKECSTDSFSWKVV